MSKLCRAYLVQIALALPFFGSAASLYADVDTVPFSDGQMAKPIIVLVLGALLAYFILVRPERMKRQALQTQREGIERGDCVYASAIRGKVMKIEGDSVFLQVGHDAQIEVPKFAIFEVQPARDLKKKGDLKKTP